MIDETHAAPYADKLIQAVLKEYPDSTYWLTTHCWLGENRTKEVLAPVLQPETVAILDNIKPTIWGDFKTDAIEFNMPFLWIDDDLYPEEEQVLKLHKAMDSFQLIDLSTNSDQLLDVLRRVATP